MRSLLLGFSRGVDRCLGRCLLNDAPMSSPLWGNIPAGKAGAITIPGVACEGFLRRLRQDENWPPQLLQYAGRAATRAMAGTAARAQTQDETHWARHEHDGRRLFLSAPASWRVSLRRDRLQRRGQYGVAGLPLAPHRAHDEAFQRPDRFAAGFALLAPPCEIGVCHERVPCLRKPNPLADSVQAAVPTPIEPMAHPFR